MSNDYNVFCRECGKVWQPEESTPLWWKAKKHSKRYLSALSVSGEECGCNPAKLEPDAPYRVFGYDAYSQTFDLPFWSLVKAVQKYLELSKDHTIEVFFTDERGITRNLSRRVERIRRNRESLISYEPVIEKYAQPFYTDL